MYIMWKAYDVSYLSKAKKFQFKKVTNSLYTETEKSNDDWIMVFFPPMLVELYNL